MANFSNPLENERAGDQSAAMLYSGTVNRNVRMHRNIPWGQAYGQSIATQARKDLLGYATLSGTVGSYFITRYLPATDPDDPSQICVKAEVRPRIYRGQNIIPYQSAPPLTDNWPTWNLMQSANNYQFADIIATYETVMYQLGEFDTTQPNTQAAVTPTNYLTSFATCHREEGYEYVTSKPGNFSWYYHNNDPPPDLQYPFAERLVYEDIEVVLYRWPAQAYPIAAIRRCLGRVNSDAVTLPTYPFNPYTATYTADLPETLQFMGAKPDWGEFPDGTKSVDIHYSFRVRTTAATPYTGSNAAIAAAQRGQGWNIFPGPDGLNYRVFRKGAAPIPPATLPAGPFLTTTFAELFQPAGI